MKTYKRMLAIALVLVLALGLMPSALAYSPGAHEAADELFELGLFRGSANGYELERRATRQEALVMLLRLMGVEDEVVYGSWTHPFSDVDEWADPYVGYAYEQGITKGMSATRFGGGSEESSAAHYITFVLRALGYSEEDGDFDSAKPWIASDKLGLTGGEYRGGGAFLRADAVLVSQSALGVTLKDGEMTLLETLVASGDVILGKGTMTATHIAQKCSPSVFSIEVGFGIEGFAYAGSGFFIEPTGIAVTNHHVIEGAIEGRITLTSGEVHKITNILYADEERDIAVFRISMTSEKGVTRQSFPYLELGNSTLIRMGEKVYTIGNPLGLRNTIADGIISSVNRNLEGSNYIQTTAPISPGSSGGALVNERGQVVGVVVGSYEYGQNLNFAVPINAVRAVDLTAEGTPLERYFSMRPEGTVMYEDWPLVPDFGAFAGVGLLEKKVSYSTAYIYSRNEVEESYAGDFRQDYCALLVSCGFELYYEDDEPGEDGTQSYYAMYMYYDIIQVFFAEAFDPEDGEYNVAVVISY